MRMRVVVTGLAVCAGVVLLASDAATAGPKARSKAAGAVPAAVAGSVLARDSEGQPTKVMLWIVGKGLARANTFKIGEDEYDRDDLSFRSADLLVLKVNGLAEGQQHELTITSGKSTSEQISFQLDVDSVPDASRLTTGSLDLARFSAIQDLEREAAIGAGANQVARGSHNHDIDYSAVNHQHDDRYFTETELGSAGTVNAASNPLEWTKLKNVPSGFADGTDDTGTTYTAGSGLSLSGAMLSVLFGGTGSTSTASRSDHNHDGSYAATSHNHDSAYYTKTQLDSTGTLNSSSNPLEWTKLKGMPSGFADGTDDTGATYTAGAGLSLSSGAFAVSFGGTGSASTASRSDHLHDSSYFTQTQLSSAGTLNSGTNPLEWTKLKGVPSGFADGTDDTGATYTAGSGLSLSSGAFAVAFGGTGSASTASRSDHLHDSSYFTQTQLSSAGTLNSGANPLEWTKLKSVPSGFADGTDDTGPSYTAGTGLSLSSGAFAVSFGGTGTGSSAARSDHIHDGTYVKVAGDTMTGALTVSNAVTVSNSSTSNAVVITTSSANTNAVNAGNTSTTSNTPAIFGYGNVGATGVQGTVYGSGSSTGTGVYALASTAGNALVAKYAGSGTSSTTNHNCAVFVTNASNVARIDNTGKGYFNGGTQTNGADFAESVEVRGPIATFEPGDVIVIDVSAARRFDVSVAPESPLVAGVYATKPGVLARPGDVAGDQSWREREIPMAIVGIVPTKVCDEGGPVRVGDLLVTASIRGHAKKAPANPAPGTILGKSLGTLTGSAGVVEVLLMAR